MEHNWSKLDVESELFGGTVIQLEDNSPISGLDFLEKKLVAKEKPIYIQCLLDADNITSIHSMENQGFRYIEFRLFRGLKTQDVQLGSSSYFPFSLELLNEEEHLKQVLNILYSHVNDDRFSNDPLINPFLAKKRLELYIRKSFRDSKTEFVFGLVNKYSNELIGFRTGIYYTKQFVQYFYSCVKSSYDQVKYSNILESCAIETLSKQGVVQINAVTSGCNVNELNESFRDFGFTLNKAMVLMRKMY